ncbi:MAG: trigger factor [Alphaproteobacteria bacterium]
MQVTEISAEGLKREFKIVVPADELDKRLMERLTAMKSEVQLKGFRPGMVPVSHLRRLFGRSTMAEIVQSVLSEVARDTLQERGEKAAMSPDFQLPDDQEDAGKVLTGDADLMYTMSLDVLPTITLTDFKKISVEREAADISDEVVEQRLNDLAESTRGFTTKSGKAADGDQLTISYLGRIDGEPFEGGTDDNATVRIGDGRFIPGFAEQLVGMETGDKNTIQVTFPEAYSSAQLAGKNAEFEIEVKAVAAPEELVIDDALAERLGMESLTALREALKEQVKGEYTQASRQKIKRVLLDKLEEAHDFELPPRLVEQEFETIWRQINDELSASKKTFADEDTTEEKAREEYHKIAERRVRLGLIMSEIGEGASIEVAEEEVQRALAAQMRQFPGQESQLMEFYRTNPDAVASLRAPIFEEKVVDYLLELVAVTDKTVSPEELLRGDDDGDTTEKNGDTTEKKD